jgi:excisionase family DNA binding protein
MENLGFNLMCRFEEWVGAVKATSEEQKRVKERVPPIHRDSGGDFYQSTTLDRALEIVRLEIYLGQNSIPVSPQETNSAVAMLAATINQDRIERRQQHEEQKEVLTATAMNRHPRSEHMTTRELADKLGCTTENILRMVRSGDIRKEYLVEGTDRPKAQRKFKRKEVEKWLADKEQESRGKGRSASVKRRGSR